MMHLPSPRPAKRQVDLTTTVSSVPELTGRARDAAGGGSRSVPELVAGDRYDLVLGDAGLAVVPAGPRWDEVPTLVGWAALAGFSADGAIDLGGGVAGQILRVAVRRDGPGWADPGEVRQFVVPAADVAGLFAAVGARAGVWAAARSDRAGRCATGTATAGSVPWFGARSAVGSARRRVAWVAARASALVAGAASGALLTRSDRRYRHGTRTAPIVTALAVVAVIAGGATAALGPAPAASAGPRHHQGALPVHPSGNFLQASLIPPTPKLAPATATPAPAPPSLAGSPPLQPHEIFGYAPYWTLPESSGFNVQDLTTLAYFSVDANGNGSLDESGPGWNGYQSQDLASLVTRAHAAGDRVVLTVTCFSQSALDQITSDPTAPARLSAALVAAVSAKNLDGVNFDFEGQGSADQVGLTNLITQVAHALHAANPHWQVTMATYASAAGDPNGFYNVAALAPALDGFFVMAYDMNDPVTPSATAPLVGGGFNDTEALQQYTAVMPASKVILGVPYYGYDWPTTNGTQGAQSTGPETPLSYGVIAAAGNPTYWDPSTETAWTSYQVGSQWHETYYDNPTSLALKAQLANSFHIRGLGIWALGMDGNDPAMLAALLGNAPPVKDFTSGPTSTSASPGAPTTTAPVGPPGSGFGSVGVFDGGAVSLTPVSGPLTGGTLVGSLDGFQTSDPQLACLASGPPLEVWAEPGFTGTDLVTATQPTDCATAEWSFSVPTAVGGGAPPSQGSGAPTQGSGVPTQGSGVPTTTTVERSPSSTTTTTTTVPSPTTTTTSTTTTSTASPPTSASHRQTAAAP